MKELTFGQKIAAGFAIVVLMTVIIGVVANVALERAVSNKDRVISLHATNLIFAERMQYKSERKFNTFRGFINSQNDVFSQRMQLARSEMQELLVNLNHRPSFPASQEAVQKIESLEIEHQAALDKLIAARKNNVPMEQLADAISRDVVPIHKRLEAAISAYLEQEESTLESAKKEASDAASNAKSMLNVFAVTAVVLAALVAFFLSRSLNHQITAAIHHMQGSSAELQAAANQQATGAREMATAMSEITLTISELLATSRQIADSSGRVSGIAEETANAARVGDATVLTTQDSILGIKRQVDMIVNYMLDLGRKSQQIGGIVEIINELSEQTNILSINAAIEAAGAGESGKRFAVVAEEIRKLADRVGGSTKDVRVLIEEIRAAVNTTVMATEGATKVVESGTRHFADLAASFRQIGTLVGATTAASKEIGLSTKQQSTAVEQVNIAVANVAQAAKETEVSSAQMLQTASELARLARDLSRIIKSGAQKDG